jgi:nitrogen fixation/metabolism regulation signal transduction histidine kinase
MKLQFKLILVGFVVIALLMAVVGFIQIQTTQTISQDVERVDELFELMVAHDVAELDAVSHIIGALYKTRIAAHELILGEEDAKEELEASIVEFDQFRLDLENSLRAAAAAAAADIDKDLKDLAEIEKAHEHLHDDVNKLIAFMEAGDVAAATELLNSEMDAELNDLHEAVELFEEDAEREISEIVKKVDDLIHDANAAAAAAAAAAGRILTVGVIASALLALGMGVFVSRSVARPLKELQHVAAQIIAGDYTVRANVTGKDKIGELAASFNAMTESLVESRKLPENILRSMKDSLFVVNTEGNISEVNQAALDMLGYNKEELMGKPISKVFGSMRGSKSNVKGQMSKVIKYVPAPEHEQDEDANAEAQN